MKYADFYQQSIINPTAFWGEEAKRIDWHQPYSQVLDSSQVTGTLASICFTRSVV